MILLYMDMIKERAEAMITMTSITMLVMIYHCYTF